MTGDSNIVWLCLIGGMLLQLTFMIVPFQEWDWLRYLGAAVFPLFVVAKSSNDHARITAFEGLLLCGVFTLVFALLFQSRLLPRLREGAILMWTALLLCVLFELGAWHPATYLLLGVGLLVLAVELAQRTLPYLGKLAVYAWFLVAVVVMGVLQFRGSDLSLIIAGGSNRLDCRFAAIDGAAGAFIGVHAAFLLEMLPIPGKGERWADFKVRWKGYLDQVVARCDDQRLDLGVALAVVFGIVLLVSTNHWLGLMPDRTFTNLVLIGLPVAWQTASLWRARRQPAVSVTPAPPTVSPADTEPGHRSGIGRARHSGKHRQ